MTIHTFTLAVFAAVWGSLILVCWGIYAFAKWQTRHRPVAQDWRVTRSEQEQREILNAVMRAGSNVVPHKPLRAGFQRGSR